MTTLWNRVCRVNLAGHAHEGVRVAFQAERSILSAPNKAQVALTNVAPDALDGLRKGAPLELVAGYEGGAGVVFSGQVLKFRHDTSQPDAVFTVEAEDGAAAHRGRVAVESFAAGTPTLEALRAVCAHHGTRLAPSVAELAEGATRGTVLARGFVMAGRLADDLEALFGALDLGWSIQSGAIVAHTRTPLAAPVAQVIAPDSGLVGSPVRAEKGRLEVTSLLRFDIAPGDVVALESAQHRGEFRVRRVVCGGDTAGRDWYSVFTLEALR